MDVGPVELLIVLAVILLLFGSKKLPELAKGMGQAAKEFRSGLHDEHESPAVERSDAVDPKAVEATTVETKPVETKPAETQTDTSTN
jgi:sec-independent protein translocase protein TatA